MKKLLFFILFSASIYSTLQAQDHFFHDLKGIEDSSGNTHLFYREYNDNEESDLGTCILWRNDLYHFDTSTKKDSLEYHSYRKFPCSSPDTYLVIHDLIFINNDLNKWVDISNVVGSYDNTFAYVNAYNGTFFHAGHNWMNKAAFGKTDTTSFAVYNFESSSIINLIEDDSLPSVEYPYVILVKNSNPDEPYCTSTDDCFYGKSDSVLIYDYNFLSLDEHHEGAIYFQRNDSLFWSDDLGENISFLNDDFSWSSFGNLTFDQDSSAIYAATHFKFSPHSVITDSSRYYQILKSTDAGMTWQEIATDSNKIYLNLSSVESGTVYYALNKQIRKSVDNGNTFTELINLDDEITGLYKKLDSDILYVLTKKELLEVNILTKETTSLKEIPISNEYSVEVPKQITLHQNYPNPFNPSTVIRYQLSKNSLVQLEVFDVTGRKVAVLVDELKTAGSHQITFDASGLSSGMYFYRLQTAGQTFTQKMMLVK